MKRKTKEGIYIPNQDTKNPNRYNFWRSGSAENRRQSHLEFERRKKFALKNK